ncbi:MAG: metallophosphoesterase [Planctomycetota bacterium]
MRIFALSDPHLALGLPGKSMDVFGPQWENHHRTIERNWIETVGDGDLVLVAGDISWAMRLPDARPDLHFLGRLPGRKVLLKGNHDFWWSSATKVRAALPPSMVAVQADAVWVDDVLVAGARLWDLPDVSFGHLIDWKPTSAPKPPPTEAERDQDRKIFEREWVRLEASLAHMQTLALAREPRSRIVLTHYPPCAADLPDCAATQLFERAGVDHVVFGHLHSVRTDLDPPPFGYRSGVGYHLTACDFIGFRPKLIAEVPPHAPQ